jgi:pimeloyl-[acyl-carrier protein] methyl ester esterase
MSLWSGVSGSGPELVLVHGWGMNSAIWTPLLPVLEARYRVTRLELPGHGASPACVARLDAWAEACLEAAPAHAAWLGWSLGGLVAQQAALLAPRRVERLFLIASTPCFVQRPDWGCAMPEDVFRQFAEALEDDIQLTLRRFLGLQVKGVADARHLLRVLDQALARRPTADPAGLRGGLRLLLEADLRARLGELRMPTHWLFGARDTLVPATITDCLRPLGQPPARLEVVPGAGHAPFLSHPDECLAWLG